MRRLFWRVCFLAGAAVGVASCGDVDDPLSEGVWADGQDTSAMEAGDPADASLPAFDVEAIYRDVTPAQAYSLIRRNQGNPNFVILDVRTPQEYATEHLRNAINIDFYASDFDAQLGALSRQKTYLVYCRTGGRSAMAVAKMKTLQFQTVYNLLGGITRWKAEGYPTVR